MAKMLYVNKRARHDYTVTDTLEVGVELLGWEVKSLKAGRFSLQAAFIYYNAAGELILKGASIHPWATGDDQPEALQTRDRRLLASRSQAAKWGGLAKQPGFTLIPLELYANERGWIKMTIALVKGKRQYDKRTAIKERDLKRRMREDVKGYRAGVI